VVLKRVLDTNAILYLLGGKLAQPLSPALYFVSVISEMELLSYPSLDDAALAQIRSFLSEVTVVELTEEIRELAIGLRRQHTLKLPDAIVAATAVSLQAQLVTNDTKLLRVPGLTCQRLELKSV
jgi:predicted nucleic acid-binding protein